MGAPSTSISTLTIHRSHLRLGGLSHSLLCCPFHRVHNNYHPGLVHCSDLMDSKQSSRLHENNHTEREWPCPCYTTPLSLIYTNIKALLQSNINAFLMLHLSIGACKKGRMFLNLAHTSGLHTGRGNYMSSVRKLVDDFEKVNFQRSIWEKLGAPKATE